jgi:hypothetical protein
MMLIARVRFVLPILAAVLVSTTNAEAAASTPHIRVTDPRLRELIADASARSTTLRELLAALEASDVIIYVRFDRSLPQGSAGRVVLMAAAGGFRYLHVGISHDLSDEAQAAMLGHELRHAVEIAGASEVVDNPTMRHLYQRIGFLIGVPGSDRYDTTAAIDAGHVVGRELHDAASFSRARRVPPDPRARTTASSPRHPLP